MVMEVLGLAKSLPIPGAGTIEYVIEEMWTDGSRESKIQSFLL
jgi:diaphanous 1